MLVFSMQGELRDSNETPEHLLVVGRRIVDIGTYNKTMIYSVSTEARS